MYCRLMTVGSDHVGGVLIGVSVAVLAIVLRNHAFSGVRFQAAWRRCLYGPYLRCHWRLSRHPDYD